MILSLLVAVGLGLAAAQDTYSCPDGWEKEMYNDKYRVAMDAIRQHCPHTIESFAAVVMGMSLTHTKEDDKAVLLTQLVPELRNYLALNRPGQSRITGFDFLCHDETWVEALSVEAGDTTEIVK